MGTSKGNPMNNYLTTEDIQKVIGKLKECESKPMFATISKDVHEKAQKLVNDGKSPHIYAAIVEVITDAAPPSKMREYFTLKENKS